MRTRTLALGTAILWMIPSRRAAAQAPSRVSEQWGQARELGGNWLAYPTLIGTAVVSTSFSQYTRLDSESVPALPVGVLGSLDVTEYVPVLHFEQSVAFTNWFEASLGLTGRGVIGVSTPAVVTQGLTGATGFNGGVGFRLFRSDASKTQLTLRLSGGSQWGEVVDIPNLIDNLANAPVRSLQSVVNGNLGSFLLTPHANYTFGGALDLAQAFTSAIALQLEGGVHGNHAQLNPFSAAADARVANGRAATLSWGGAAVTLDGQGIGIPVGLMAEYRASYLSGVLVSSYLDPEGLNQAAALSVLYTGRTDLQLGLTARYVSFPPIVGRDPSGAPAASGQPEVWGVEVGFRHIW